VRPFDWFLLGLIGLCIYGALDPDAAATLLSQIRNNLATLIGK
jgi:hypothetical protein